METTINRNNTVRSGDSTFSDFIRVVLALFLPPIGVFAQTGFSKDLLLNIILTLFGYIPGIVHAVWIIARK